MSDDPQGHACLADALAAAQESAATVIHDGVFQAKTHRYTYASTEAIITEAKKALAGHGISLIPVEMTIRAGVAGAAAILHTVWSVAFKADREVITADWPIGGGGGQPFDKAVAGARTASLGYLLRDLLQLPREEEGTGLDDDRRDAFSADDPPPSNSAIDERLVRERRAKMEADKAAAMARGRESKPPESAGDDVPQEQVLRLVKYREALAAQKNAAALKAAIEGWKSEIAGLHAALQRAALTVQGARESELADRPLTDGQKQVLARLDAAGRSTTERG